MSNTISNKLLIIVPVTKMAGKLTNFSTWLSSIPDEGVKVIVVHDYADDKTSCELKKIIQLNSKTKIQLIEEKVQSPGYARNIGLREDNAEWVSFVDSDDLVNVSTLLSMIETAPSLTEIIVGDYSIRSAEGTREVKTSDSSDPKMNVAMNPGFWRMIYKREVIGQHQFTSYKMGEDQLFLLHLDFFTRNTFFSSLSPYIYFTDVNGQLTSRFDAKKDISKVVKQSISILNRSTNLNKKYVGMIVLKQLITEFKCYVADNLFIAIYKFINNITHIKINLLPILFRNLLRISLKRFNQKPKRTYVVLAGGLGNQLFQYAAALSRNSSRILLDGNLSKPRLNINGLPVLTDFKLDANVNILPKRRNSKFYLKCTNYIIRMGVNPVGFKKTKVNDFLAKYLYSVIFSLRFKTNLTLIPAKDNGYFPMKKEKKNELLIGYFQTYKWASEKEIKSKLFSLELVNKSEMLLDFLKQYNGKSILSIHIRLGDYRDQHNFGLVDGSYYQSAINFVKSKFTFDYIWLFSDEPSEAVKILPTELMQNLVIVPDFNGRAAETLEAMRHCSSYIIANSSLSWWGAFLSYSSDEPLVIAPKPWFKAAFEPNLITNPSWIRLPAWPDLCI